MSRPARVLWLHTQPEHYFNCMMDDLARHGDVEYVAAFSGKGAGWYKEVPVPVVAKTVFLRPRGGGGGMEGKSPTYFGKYHADWRADLYPLEFDVAIVAGYGYRTHREVIHDCRRRGIPVAMFSDSNMRSQMGTSLKDRVKRTVKKRMLHGIVRDVDLMLTANRLGVEYWKFYGAPEEKIVVCPYYADYGRVDAARQTERGAVLGRVGLQAQERVILSSARLVPAKGLDLMIKAFLRSGLAEKGYCYLIAGVGPLEGELKALAGTAEGKAVRFIGFQQPTDNLALMAHADVFVLPSVYEPHGIVVHEAMAAGTPVIASDVCGAAYDLVDAGVNGEIFRSGDAEDLRAKLLAVLGDAERARQLRVAARQKFERWFEEFSPIKVVDREVRRLLAGRAAKGAG